MIDKSKKYQTRDGRNVEVLATDMGGKYPVLARYPKTGDPERWAANQFTATGRCYDGGDESGLDLIEVKETARLDLWLNLYRGADGKLGVWGVHLDGDKAKRSIQRDSNWFATKHIVVEATKGDEQ